MSNLEARIALSRLIAKRVAELDIARSEFMKLTGFTTESSYSSYLAGFSKLHPWQVPLVVKALELDEGQILLVCLAQNHNEWCMALFRRHIRPQPDRKSDRSSLDET